MDLCGEDTVQEVIEDSVDKQSLSIKMGSEEEKERNWEMQMTKNRGDYTKVHKFAFLN